MKVLVIFMCQTFPEAHSACLRATKQRISNGLGAVYTYSAQKAITLLVKGANAGGAYMILVVLTVSVVLSASWKMVTSF
jgi:hypothetical protein